MNKSAEVQRLIEEYYKTNNKELLDKIVPLMEAMINKLVMPYLGAVELDDLYQVAWETVMKCIQNYDISRGVLLTTYCYTSISGACKNYVTKMKKHENKYNEKGQCIRKLIPMDSYIKPPEGGNDPITVEATIPSNDMSPEDAAMYNEGRIILHEVLFNLKNDKRRQMITMYLQGIRQVDIAKEYNVSRVYVSQTINDFIKLVAEQVNK